MGVANILNFENAFLFGDKGQTQGTPSPVLSDKHFAMLLDILNDEKQSRVKLETKLELLEKKLLATHQSVTDIYYSGVQNNATLEHCMVDLSALTTKFSQLEKKNDLVQKSLHDIQLKQEMMQNTVHRTTQELESIKHLKTVTEMTLVLNIQNQTTQLAKEMQLTHNYMNSIQNDVNARKQEFVALFQKAVSTDNSVVQLKNNLSQFKNLSQTEMAGNVNNIRNQIVLLDNRHNVLSAEIKKTIQSEILMLRSELNKTDSKLSTQIHKTTKQVSITTCAKEKQYFVGSNIKFPFIRQRTNVSDAIISALEINGSFSCEKSGLYLITVFIMTNTPNPNAWLYANDKVLTFLHFSPKESFQTSSATVLRKLDLYDTVYVKIGSHRDMRVFGNSYSCMSILELP